MKKSIFTIANAPRLLHISLLLVFVVAIYGRFLWNPIIFDDLSFFMLDDLGAQPIDTFTFKWLEVRSLPYATLAWTKAWFGLDLIYFRVGNLILHAATVITLYFSLQCLLTEAYFAKTSNSLDARQAAFIAALLFGLHPVATYAAGYLVQRSILMATLFSLLSVWVYARASLEGKPVLLWVTVPLYYLAVYSKEHAIMMIAVLASLTPLLHANWGAKLRERWGVFAAMSVIAVLVVVSKKGILGTVYEIDAKNMLGEDYGPLSYPLSIITQCGLFFKYVFMWVWPNINAMSIDMREPFVRALISPQLSLVFLYLCWGGVAIWLLLKRGNRGLVGFAMLFPWLLFFSEFASVRIQEPFVLYRSYLWAGGSLLALPVLLNGINKKLVVVVAIAMGTLFMMLSMERLVTLSNPILVWTDAKKLVDGRTDIQGSDRIYYNLGRHLLLNDMLDASEENLKTALVIAPDFAPPHGMLGAVYNRRKQWDLAISEYTIARNINQKRGEAPSSIYLMGRAGAYEGAGKLQLAVEDYLEACRIDFRVCEKLRKSAVPKQSP